MWGRKCTDGRNTKERMIENGDGKIEAGVKEALRSVEERNDILKKKRQVWRGR